MKDKYDKPPFYFKGYFPNFSSKPDKIERFLNDHEITLDWTTDYYKTKAKEYDIEVLPTVVIRDERNNSVLYYGSINNRFVSVGKQRRVINKHYVQDALESIENQREIKLKSTEAVGCFINYKEF